MVKLLGYKSGLSIPTLSAFSPVFHPPPGTGLAQIVATKRTFHTPDMTLEKATSIAARSSSRVSN